MNYASQKLINGMFDIISKYHSNTSISAVYNISITIGIWTHLYTMKMAIMQYEILTNAFRDMSWMNENANYYYLLMKQCVICLEKSLQVFKWVLVL